MTQPVNNSFKQPQRNALWKRLGCLGSLGILSSGVGLTLAPAQAATSAADLISPQPTASVAPETPIAPIASPSPAVSAPEPTVEASPMPAIQVDATSLPAAQPTPQPKAQPSPIALPSPAATEGEYEAPSTIVFSERSSGCQFSVSAGQGVANGCPVPTAGIPAATPQINAVSASPADVLMSAAPVRVGGLSLSSAGISVTAPTPRGYYNRFRPIGRPGNGNVSLLFPLSIPAPITSIFGWRVHPIFGTTRFHSGTDLGAPMGTPVLASLSGRVILADTLGGYGLSVALEHDQGKQQTLYAHLSELFVQPGEWVKQGTVIGRVGSTGNSTGPHLHFEFRQFTPDGWVAQDPGMQLEAALAQLVKVLQVAQTQPPAVKPAPPTPQG